jgi:hypothetical protein
MLGRVRAAGRAVRLPVLLVVMALGGVGGAQVWGQDGGSSLVIRDARLSESSGLALAPDDPNLLYSINDSGHDPLVFVIDRTTGDVVGTTTLLGPSAETLDTEALAVVGDTLWVADVGDNLHARDDAALYSVPVPQIADVVVTPTAQPVVYDGEPPDVEAVVFTEDDRWLVTKSLFGGRLLELPKSGSTADALTPVQVPGVSLPRTVTGATVLPGRDAAVLRNYGSAYVYRLSDWSLVGSFDLPSQQQGESITALPPDGETLLVGSEGSPALVDTVRVPADILAEIPVEPRQATTAPSDGEEPTAPAQPASPAEPESSGLESAELESAEPESAEPPGWLVATGAVGIAAAALAGWTRWRRGRTPAGREIM